MARGDGGTRAVGAPRSLAAAVALVAAGMLLVELLATRIFSVLFYYHYSFFAVSLVMTGLAFGGLVASRWNLRDLSENVFKERLSGLAILFSLGVLFAAVFLASCPPLSRFRPLSSGTVAVFAVVFVPGLTAAGAFLAAAFSRNQRWIGGLYAADLVAAALACVAAIPLLRLVQGPAGLLAAALLASTAGFILGGGAGRLRVVAGFLAVGTLVGMTANVMTDGRFMRLPLVDKTLVEVWNEHSRIIAVEKNNPQLPVTLVIDRRAATDVPAVRRRLPGEPIPVESWWNTGVSYVGYRLGRPLREVAIIGVGGGRDLLAALASGAQHVDGYELNGILVDLLFSRFSEVNPAALWPEVSLIHGEARVGIAGSGKRYDLVQAALIDTWASTAAGGFVLSENGLYTVEGWRTFLDSMSDTGVLSVTRFYLPDTPAEAHRLVSLAVETLSREGILDPAGHLILVAEGPQDRSTQAVFKTTILVSKAAFTPAEILSLSSIAQREGLRVLAAPDRTPTDATLASLRDPARRAEAVASSPYDISPPTDLRPYFFLQVRPLDVLRLGGKRNFVLEITFRAVGVMTLLASVAAAFALAVLAVGATTKPGARATAQGRRLVRWMSLYFLGIGFGYVLVQLGLHQRLILVLGHPTLALAVLLGSMLLGTGLGSFATRRLLPEDGFARVRRFRGAWLAILVALAVLALAMPAVSLMDGVGSPVLRAVAAGLVSGGVGFVLGFGFPLGVRLASPAGEWAVQKMWAVNGAASIAGSALAAVLGMSLGCRAVIVAGLLFYLVVAACGARALVVAPRALREAEALPPVAPP